MDSIPDWLGVDLEDVAVAGEGEAEVEEEEQHQGQEAKLVCKDRKQFPDLYHEPVNKFPEILQNKLTALLRYLPVSLRLNMLCPCG